MAMGWAGLRIDLARALLAMGGFAALAGCAQTTRIDDSVTPAALASSKSAVAIMRIGSASPACINNKILLGVREGEGFRRHQVVTVAQVRSLTEVPVAEVQLAAGEYHVIGYACASANKTAALSDPAGGQLFRTSYANFRLNPGEMVNLGYLTINAAHVNNSAFGRPLRTWVTVTDWPLAEIERFRAMRPQVYARMTTRLMAVTDRHPDATDAECARWRTLKAEGKAATLPKTCA